MQMQANTNIYYYSLPTSPSRRSSRSAGDFHRWQSEGDLNSGVPSSSFFGLSLSSVLCLSLLSQVVNLGMLWYNTWLSLGDGGLPVVSHHDACLE